MADDWLDSLDQEERRQWDDFVNHFRKEALGHLAGSAAVISLIPSEDGMDIKFAVELGFSILLDKPIIAVLMPGAKVSRKLALVTGAVVRADLDTEEGRLEILKALERVIDKEAT